MPAFITHNLFAKDVLEKSNNIHINISNYLAFSQSFDLLYYYFSANTKNMKSIKKMGGYAHTSNTQIFFINVIRYIKEHNLKNNKYSNSFLYGTITHYVLDSIIHPFVFYYTGIYRTEDSSTKRYQGLHTLMEHQIDMYLYYQIHGKDLYKSRLDSSYLSQINLDNNTIEMINDVIDKTFHKSNIAHYFIQGQKCYNFTYKFIIQDRFGIKKNIYKILDFFAPKRKNPLKCYSNHYKTTDTWLNNDKKSWNHPCLKNLTFSYSFHELYDIAVERCLELFVIADKCINNDIDIEDLPNYFFNISYLTGLDLSKKKPMRYFI